MAQTIKLKRSATQGAAPTTSNLALGEVAINTYDGKMYIKKDVGGTESIVEIGGSGANTVSYLEAGMIEYEYTATSNQTTFSGSDSNSATLSYTANSIMVFLNGVLQDDGVDYTATNGTSVVFSSALTANDEVRIVAFTNVTTSAGLNNPTKLDTITTVNAQAAYSLTLNSSAYTPSSQNALIVSLNGITQEPGDSFTISGSTITFSPALVTGDVVDYIVDMGRAVTIGEYSGDLAVGGELEVTGDIIGDLRGATLFKAQAGESLAKGDVVYISGISGNTTVVSKADADDAAKMPAFGLVAAAASSGNPVDIYTFGELSGLDTSSFSEGDELFVSTTAGTLTNSAPTGESSKLQKIAKVTRSDNSAGSVFIMGAGRSNAVPNLDDGDIFIGNASNQAVTASLNTKIEDYLDGGTSTPVFSTINSGNITTTGYIAGPSTFTIDPAAVGDNTGTLVVAGNLQVDGTTTTINSTTMTVDDLNITLASGAANAAAANGAGITVDGASATLTYNGTNDDWNFNKTLNVTGDLTITNDPFPRITLSDSGGTNQKMLLDVSGGYSAVTAWDNTSHGRLDFKSYDGTTTRLNMRIDSSGKLLVNETTFNSGYSSFANMQISHSTAPGLVINTNTAGASNYGRLAFTIGNSTGNEGLIRYNSNDYHMSFWTDAQERARIDSSGNVGIGIGNTDPKARLHVGGEIISGAAASTSGQVILKSEYLSSSNDFLNILGTQRSNSAWVLGYGVKPSPTTSGVFLSTADNSNFKRGALVIQEELIFMNSASQQTAVDSTVTLTERMRIDSDGNVGIDINAPAEKLHVRNGDIAIDAAGSSNTASLKFINDNERSRITSNYDTSGGGRLGFWTDTTGGSLVQRMTIDSAGKVYNGTGGTKNYTYFPLPYFYMGASSITDEYLIISRYNDTGSAVVATGVDGEILFSRGNTGAGNSQEKVEISVQDAWTGTPRVIRFNTSDVRRFIRLDIITVDSQKYVAAKAASSGGGSTNHIFFRGIVTGESTDSKLLTRVRESDSNVTVNTTGWMYPASFEYRDDTTGGFLGIRVGGADVGQFKSTGLHLENGKGIDFGASSGSGSTSTLLDDYEEGTWTPALSGYTGTSYGGQTGFYTKVGRLVTLHFQISISSIGTFSNNSRITGLPFSSGTNITHATPSQPGLLSALNATRDDQYFTIYLNSSDLFLYSKSGTPYNGNSWQAGDIAGTYTYFTS